MGTTRREDLRFVGARTSACSLQHRDVRCGRPVQILTCGHFSQRRTEERAYTSNLVGNLPCAFAGTLCLVLTSAWWRATTLDQPLLIDRRRRPSMCRPLNLDHFRTGQSRRRTYDTCSTLLRGVSFEKCWNMLGGSVQGSGWRRAFMEYIAGACVAASAAPGQDLEHRRSNITGSAKIAQSETQAALCKSGDQSCQAFYF